jgi:hypothetical protein
MAKDEYNCVCCKFEKDGLLCSHVLKVMLHQNIDKIPEKYFIDRWRKNEKKIQTSIQPERIANNDTLMYNVLSQKLVQLASKGSKSKRKYEYLSKEIDKIEEMMAKMDGEEDEMHENNASRRTVVNLNTTSTDENTHSTIQLQDPDVANTKGRPRHLTIREAIKANKFYKCSHCGSTQHTKKNCHNKHLQYDLPKTRKTRRSKKAGQGEYMTWPKTTETHKK